MNAPKPKEFAVDPPAADAGEAASAADEGPAEVGGRNGPDPTRYGDWEVDGRCVDF
ncbi:MAG: DUF1674 domain-containing protein [Alphaproteobacteria bacterium]